LTRHRRWERILLVLVSAAFVVLGIALRDRVPWYATAFFALCLVVSLFPERWLHARSRVGDEQLAIDDVGITRTARKLREHVAWADIARVRIITTDKGPQFEDVFFVLDSKSGGGCVVPHDLAQRGGLLEALQTRLEGVDSGQVIEAMLTISNRTFTIWESKDSSTGPTEPGGKGDTV
jgi:hypothetical protein